MSFGKWRSFCLSLDVLNSNLVKYQWSITPTLVVKSHNESLQKGGTCCDSTELNEDVESIW